MSKRRPYDGWVIKAPKGAFWEYTFAPTRNRVICEHMSANMTCPECRRWWKNNYREGYRLVRVKLVEVT